MISSTKLDDLRLQGEHCGQAYSERVGGWLAAHWTTPGTWPVTYTMPCGHTREVWRSSFTPRAEEETSRG
jgi:hypothetical protein